MRRASALIRGEIELLGTRHDLRSKGLVDLHEVNVAQLLANLRQETADGGNRTKAHELGIDADRDSLAHLSDHGSALNSASEMRPTMPYATRAYVFLSKRLRDDEEGGATVNDARGRGWSDEAVLLESSLQLGHLEQRQ